MASPVRRDSVSEVEEYLTTITDEEVTSFPSDDEISYLPSPSSSPDLPDIEELLNFHKQLRSLTDGSPPLPNSSLPSSPVPDDDISMEEDFPLGRVFLYNKAGEYPIFFEIPSTNGFFSLLNDKRFVKQSNIITHPLEVYDVMIGDFVGLPPLAYWRQYSSDHFLIIREHGLDDDACPGIRDLIDEVEDPVDTMSRDPISVGIWRLGRAPTPPSTQILIVVPPSTQAPTYSEQAVQATGGQKRKHAALGDEVTTPPAKVPKSFKQGSGNTVGDQIIVWDN